MRTSVLMRRHRVLMMMLFILGLLFLPIGIVGCIIFVVVLVASSVAARRVDETLNLVEQHLSRQPVRS